jgi:hypothetical protein
MPLIASLITNPGALPETIVTIVEQSLQFALAITKLAVAAIGG